VPVSYESCLAKDTLKAWSAGELGRWAAKSGWSLWLLSGEAVLLRKAGCWVATAVGQLAQQGVQPTPLLRHFGPEKILVVQPVLPRTWVVLW
jgi:hypothetical protein